MSPEERQLLTGLFDRIKGSANVARDPEAEALIADAVRSQPYAPYFLAQAVLVQDQALQAANQRLEDLQAQVEQLQQGQGQVQQPPAGGGFLNSLGSIFGGPSAAPPPPPRPQQPLPGGPWGQEPQAPRGYQPQQQPYPPQGGAPWGGPPPGGGGFLSGALQSAAGVAGGVLLADSIRNLFGGHAGGLGGLGIGSGLGGLGGLGTGLGTTAPGLGTGGETIVNNYYDDTGRNDANDADFYDDSSSNGSNDDGSFDV